MLKVGDYVAIYDDLNGIEKDSVGIVRRSSGERVTIFFIGKGQEVEMGEQSVRKILIEQTGKPYKLKICNVCHQLKEDMNDFDINQTDAKGRKTTRPSCKKCRIDIDGHPMLPSESRRMESSSPSGIFTCPICQKTSIVGVTAKLVKDHDHKTGKGREWICDSCNTGLGRFKDDPILLQRAIDYLDRHSQKNADKKS